MPHVGYVQDAFQFISVIFQHPPDKVHKNICAEIAYMRVAVNGGAAGIHVNMIVANRLKVLFVLVSVL